MNIRFLLLLCLMVGCTFEEDTAVRYLPIAPQELMYHKGDVLAFTIDSATTGAAIVTGYSREVDDSTHIWYDLVFTDYTAQQPVSVEQLKSRRLFGRKVASSLTPAGYSICVNIEAVRNDCFVDNAAKFHLMGHLPLDTTLLKYGGQGACSNYDDLIRSFHWGQERRQLPPDHYNEFVGKLDKFRPDEYFAVADFLLK